MIITIESPSGKRKWRIEPFDNGLCFRILKTSMNPKAKSEWINCECYPTTLPGALEKVIDRMLKDPDDPCDMEFAPADIKRNVTRCIKKYLEDIGVEIEKEA